MKQRQTKHASKLNPQWVHETRDSFKEFLEVTEFPHPDRDGSRGRKFEYPEWLIMFIAVLSVKAKVKNYLAIHRLALQYWNSIAEGTEKEDTPISERQLRDRLMMRQELPAASAAGMNCRPG